MLQAVVALPGMAACICVPGQAVLFFVTCSQQLSLHVFGRAGTVHSVRMGGISGSGADESGGLSYSDGESHSDTGGSDHAAGEHGEGEGESLRGRRRSRASRRRRSRASNAGAVAAPAGLPSLKTRLSSRRSASHKGSLLKQQDSRTPTALSDGGSVGSGTQGEGGCGV
jgi:hypothetical protein